MFLFYFKCYVIFYVLDNWMNGMNEWIVTGTGKNCKKSSQLLCLSVSPLFLCLCLCSEFLWSIDRAIEESLSRSLPRQHKFEPLPPALFRHMIPFFLPCAALLRFDHHHEEEKERGSDRTQIREWINGVSLGTWEGVDRPLLQDHTLHTLSIGS